MFKTLSFFYTPDSQSIKMDARHIPMMDGSKPSDVTVGYCNNIFWNILYKIKRII